MRWNRLISLLLLSALLLACGREPVAEPVDTCQPILFSPSISVETKTDYRDKPDDATVLLHVGSEAGVFGIWIEDPDAASPTPVRVFNNTRLHCDDVESPLNPANPAHSYWNYSPLKYWQNAGDYYFAAVFPYLPDDVRIRSEYFVQIAYKAGSNLDLMVSRAYRRVTSSDGVKPVNLAFNHATSAVRFLFGKSSSSDSDSFTLTDFKLMNLTVGGTLQVDTQISENQAISFSAWTPGYRSNLSSVTDLPLSVPYPADPADPEDYVQIGWYYMVPQDMSTDTAVKFSVSYNGETPVTTEINLTDADNNGSADRWLPNCVYNYYITLTTGGLSLTVKTIPWDEVQVTTNPFLFE